MKFAIAIAMMLSACGSGSDMLEQQMRDSAGMTLPQAVYISGGRIAFALFIGLVLGRIGSSK